MNILCLTSRLPYPPNRGDRLRAFHFIEHFSREHDLTLVSFIAQDTERRYVEPLHAYCQGVHVLRMSPRRSQLAALANIWRRAPLQALYYRSREMRNLVNEVMTAKKFDVAYVHLFRMVPYVISRSDLYRIVDLTDVISKEVNRSLPYRGLLWRLIYRLENPRIERYERWAAKTLEEAWLISEAGRRILAADCPAANIRVVPNGVDTEEFYPTDQSCEPNSLVFVGNLRVFHNIDAAVYLAREILPRVQQQIPNCVLKIVGASPSPEVQRLAGAPAVTVTGFVTDLNGVLNRSAVFVAPLRFAAGVQNKVLEAMAAGRPVVTTSVVNAGLNAQPGHQLLIADNAETMARRIVALLRDERLRAKIGHAGLAFVQQKYSWNHAVERMRRIEESLISGGGSTPD